MVLNYNRLYVNLRVLFFFLFVIIMVFCCISVVAIELKPLPKEYSSALGINSPFAGGLSQVDVDILNEDYVIASSLGERVSVWPISNPQKPKTFFTPLKLREKRRSFGTAISPDGKLVAVAVPPLINPKQKKNVQYGTGNIFIYERTSGYITKLLDGIETRVRQLRFSPDGQYIAALLNDGCGVRVWSTNTWKLVGWDDEKYGGGNKAINCCSGLLPTKCVSKHKNFGLLFTQTDNTNVWLVTSGQSGVRTYSKSNNHTNILSLKSHLIPSGDWITQPYDIAIDINEKKLAVGDYNAPRVSVLHLETLKKEKLFNLSPTYFNSTKEFNQTKLTRVAWVSSDTSEWLYAGGFVINKYFTKEFLDSQRKVYEGFVFNGLVNNLVRWNINDKKPKPEFIPVTEQSKIISLRYLKKINKLLLATDKSISLFDRPYNTNSFKNVDDSQNINIGQSEAINYEGINRPFAVSKNGRSILVQSQFSNLPTPKLLFDLDTLTLTKVTDQSSQIAKFEGKVVLNGTVFKEPSWKGAENRWWGQPKKGSSIIFFKEPVPEKSFEPGDISRSIDTSTASRTVFWGLNNKIRYWEFKEGIICEKPIRFEAAQVNRTPDNKYFIVGHSDGVIRWYKRKWIESKDQNSGHCTFERLLSVYITRDKFDQWTWAAWTPKGHWVTDPKTSDLIGWQVRNAFGGIDFIHLAKFPEYYDPEAIRKALDGDASVEDFDDSNFNRALETIQQRPQYQVKLLSVNEDKPCKTNSANAIDLRQTNRHICTKQVRLKIQATSSPQPWKPMALQIKVGGVNAQKRLIQGSKRKITEPLLIEKPGIYSIKIELPRNVRKSHNRFPIKFLIGFGNKNQDLYDAMEQSYIWHGKIVSSKVRKLWAILVGFSEYQAKSIEDLSYAHNDAIDFTQILIDDFKRQHSLATNEASNSDPDYDELNLSLILSHSDEDNFSKNATNRFTQIAKSTPKLKFEFIHSNPTFKGKIIRSFNNIIERLPEKENDDETNIFMFFYSGHGAAVGPTRKGLSKQILLTPETRPGSDRSNVEAQGFSLGDLKSKLEEMKTIDKIIFLDACRDNPYKGAKLLDQQGAANFLRTLDRTELLFSSKTGKPSYEDATWAFENKFPLYTNKGRLFNKRGNGLFTLSLLTGLSCRQVDTGLDGKGRIDIREVMDFIKVNMDQSRNPELSKFSTEISRPSFWRSQWIDYEPIWLRSINDRSLKRCLP